MDNDWTWVVAGLIIAAVVSVLLHLSDGGHTKVEVRCPAPCVVKVK